MLHAKRTVSESVQDAVPRKWWWPFGRKGGFVERTVTYRVVNDANQVTHTLVYDEKSDPGPQMVCARLCFESAEMVALDNQG